MDGVLSGNTIERAVLLKSINWLRQKVLPINLKYSLFRIDKERDIQLINNGGWHFNNLMKPDMLSLKLKTFAHTEYASKKFSDVKIVKNKIKNFEDLFNKNLIYKKVLLNYKFPKYILKNKKKLKNWIL